MNSQIIEDYFKILEEVYKYFDFKEDWVVYPLEDRREYYWKIIDNKDVIYSINEVFDEDSEDYYQDEIYTQRFYDKHVYRGKDYTMIFVDTHVDGNSFFAIYDNTKEIK